MQFTIKKQVVVLKIQNHSDKVKVYSMVEEVLYKLVVGLNLVKHMINQLHCKIYHNLIYKMLDKTQEIKLEKVKMDGIRISILVRMGMETGFLKNNI